MRPDINPSDASTVTNRQNAIKASKCIIDFVFNSVLL